MDDGSEPDTSGTTGGKWWLSVDTVALEDARNLRRCSATEDVEDKADCVGGAEDGTFPCSSESELDRPAGPVPPMPMVRLVLPVAGDVLLRSTVADAEWFIVPSTWSWSLSWPADVVVMVLVVDIDLVAVSDKEEVSVRDSVVVAECCSVV